MSCFTDNRKISMADSDSGTHVTDISESLQDDFESRKEGTIMKNQSIITARCSWSTIYICEPNFCRSVIAFRRTRYIRYIYSSGTLIHSLN